MIDVNEEEERADEKKNAKIMLIYIPDLYNSIAALLKKALQLNYEPLLQEVMDLLSITSSLIESDFA